MNLLLTTLRTSCDCRACQICCETKPGFLIPEDLVNIVPRSARGVYDLVWCEIYLFAAGSKVIYKGAPLTVPTLCPQGFPECVFYVAGRCTIHSVAPFGCSRFDMHIDKRSSDQLVQAGLQQCWQDCEADGPYYRIWSHLHAKGIIAPPVAARQQLLSDKLAAAGLD
jgi:hypothetical protein